MERNADKLTKPFESPLPSGHFCFSHGHLLTNAGHDESLENNFSWEEIWMSYMYWKKGYTLYAPNEVLIWHNYNRSYRPQFDTDKGKILQHSKTARHGDVFFKNSKDIRHQIFKDAEFREYMDEKWGVDLLGRKVNKKSVDAGLDPYYFWDPESEFYHMR